MGAEYRRGYESGDGCGYLMSARGQRVTAGSLPCQIEAADMPDVCNNNPTPGDTIPINQALTSIMI